MKALGHYVAQVLALLNAMTKGWPCEGLSQPKLPLTHSFVISNSFRHDLSTFCLALSCGQLLQGPVELLLHICDVFE